VIGGANADVKGRVDAPLVAGTSNPGHTTLSAGGVARNVAESLAHLGVHTALVSVVGDDALGRFVLAHTAAAGVDIGAVRTVPGGATGTYAAILDVDGSLVAGVASMRVLDALTADMVRAHASLVRDARWVMLDANLSPATLTAALDLAARTSSAVAVDPVSVAKATRLMPVLHTDRPIALLTPNREELAAMIGAEALDDAELPDACRPLHARGVETVWVRLGVSGSVLCAADGRVSRIPTVPATDIADVTGAGDAALAGYLWATLRGHGAVAAARYGTAAALRTLHASGSADDHLDPDVLATLERTIPEAS